MDGWSNERSKNGEKGGEILRKGKKMETACSVYYGVNAECTVRVDCMQEKD